MSDTELQAARRTAARTGAREDRVRLRRLELRAGACDHQPGLEWVRLFRNGKAGDQEIEARCPKCRLGVVTTFNPAENGVRRGDKLIAFVTVDDAGDARIRITHSVDLADDYTVWDSTWPMGEYEELGRT